MLARIVAVWAAPTNGYLVRTKLALLKYFAGMRKATGEKATFHLFPRPSAPARTATKRVVAPATPLGESGDKFMPLLKLFVCWSDVYVRRLTNFGVPTCTRVRVIWQTEWPTPMNWYSSCLSMRLAAKPAKLLANCPSEDSRQSLRIGDSFRMVRLNFRSGVFRPRIEANDLPARKRLAPPIAYRQPERAVNCSNYALEPTAFARLKSSGVLGATPEQSSASRRPPAKNPAGHHVRWDF
jgi:hypothetical protein